MSIPGRSRHAVVVGEGEAMLVLPGLSWSKGGAELATKPLMVKAIGGRDRMAVCARTNSPPTVMMKSRFPKHTCAPGTQLMLWLAIRGLVWNAQSPLPSAPTIGVSNKHRLVN